MHSPSRGEKKMKKFVRRWVRDNVPDAKIMNDNAGNVYVTRGIADTYPCVVAHLDQVQTKHSEDFEVLDCGPILIGYSEKNHRQEGLGADDKNGIWVALKCLAKYDTMKAAFFIGEEIGCVGSTQADMQFFEDCRFVLQCDRRNGNDLITNAGVQLASEEFVIATNYWDYGYKEANGLMTDVQELKYNGLGVSALNISCGYYAPHTDEEFTNKAELWNCLAFVENIIENCTDVYPHEYVAPVVDNYCYKGGKWGNYYDWYDYDDWAWEPVDKKKTKIDTATEAEIWEQYDTMMWVMSGEIEYGNHFDLNWFKSEYRDEFYLLSELDFDLAYEQLKRTEDIV